MKMKHFSLLGAGMALLALGTSCSNDINVDEPEVRDGEVSYIAVNLVANQPSTRVDEAPGQYEEGTPTENAVNVVRLYFFDSYGEPFVVSSTGNKSYFDLTNTTTVGKDMPNVEKIVTAEASIVTDGINFPSQIVAVLNPSQELNGLNNPQLGTLENVTANFLSPLTSEPSTGFVMSNSVYPKGGKTMEATQVSSTDFYTTSEGALANPVNIYVERVAAKVTVSVDTSDESNIEGQSVTYGGETFTIYPTGVNYLNQPLFVRFLGWNATATAQTSYLTKHINPEWDDNLFGTLDTGISEPWYYTPYFRSYWAINPSPLNIGYGNFNGTTVNGVEMPSAQAITSFTTNNFTYLQENAASGENGNGAIQPSQVIVAAQLCYATGQPVELAEWAFGKYDVQSLKTAYLAELEKEYGKIYVKKDGGAFSQINVNDITFATAGSLDSDLMDWQAKGRYYVYAQVVNPSTVYTTDPADAENNTILGSEINGYLQNMGPAKIWTNGFTYYYFTIRHLGANENDPGYYGVVRNHVYKATITSLAGLGTPVYDPTEVIYPEKPETENGYIAAKINVLSWRIVSQNVDFAW